MDESRPENSPEPIECREELEIHDDLPAEAQEQDDLDGLRIRQIAQGRRAAYRTRGYLLIACVVCLALAGQLVWSGVSRFGGGATVIGSGFVLVSLIVLALGWKCWKRAGELKAEADASRLEEPKTPPDFSKLSDGSQAWKNLEDVE